ncbi:MAG: sodium/glutamate symporter [Pseudomonadota bacterium]|jgi:ESS family glutamate:Na+ symporter
MTLPLDFIQTTAVGAVALFIGVFILRRIPVLRRYNIPAAVIGGLGIAILVTASREFNLATVKFDTSLQAPLMTAFFTSIGLSASVGLLKAGTRQALVFLALATFLAVIQSLIGIATAVAFGQSPLLGVLMGPAALTGGPATALAFAPQFAAAGVASAESVAIAAAMAGIVMGGLVGGPIVTRLIVRYQLHSPTTSPTPAAQTTTSMPVDSTRDEERDLLTVLKGVGVLLVAMGIGSWLGGVMKSADLTLPGYVGAMLMGAVIRNMDDQTQWLQIPHELTERMGLVCLSLFLSVALMNLKLWELTSIAAPLLVNLFIQVIAVAVFCWYVVFRVMGRDYDAAVMSGGFTGFMLGTTANAMAVMHSVVQRYGPSPRAFLVAPIVGAFFIDFTNALLITGLLNLLS